MQREVGRTGTRTRPRLLVVVAHPDDESFGTGSVIAAGVAVTVCCATRGEAGAPVTTPDDDADLGKIREDELHRAARTLGVDCCILLGFGDSGMHGAPHPHTLAAAPFKAVTAAVRAVVTAIDPDVVVTLDPEHGDGHRDHTVIARATCAACQDHPHLRLYAWALSRALLARWFAELEHLRPDSGHLDLARDGLGRPEADITTTIDISRFRPLRQQAIADHASQTSPYDGMPPDLRDEFLDTDRLVRLQPRWTGGPHETCLFPPTPHAASSSQADRSEEGSP